MKRYVYSSDFKLYNANVRGKNVGDCVKRSMSLAYDLPYSEIGKLLNAEMKEQRMDKWNIKRVFQQVIYNLGSKPYEKIDTDLEGAVTVDEFGDANPEGTYLLLVGRKPGETTHMVCVRNGKVWDSWDSRMNFVTGFYDVTGVSNKEAHELTKDYVKQIAEEHAYWAISDEMDRFVAKKKWPTIGVYCRAFANTSYQIMAECRVDLAKTELVKKDRIYTFTIKLTLEPSWTEEEIIDFVKKTGKIRAYDRMYAIADQEKKLAEAAEIEQQLSNKRGHTLFFTPQEQKFVNTLPGWIRPLIRYVNIHQPNQWSDSYEIWFDKLPDDDKHPHMDRVDLIAWNASELKDKINRYKDTFEVDRYDYEYDAEF